VFNIKPDSRYQSCLVAKGFSQVEGIDFDELFSPVVCYETAQLLLAVAALEGLDIQSVDVKIAYLYGVLCPVTPVMLLLPQTSHEPVTFLLTLV